MPKIQQIKTDTDPTAPTRYSYTKSHVCVHCRDFYTTRPNGLCDRCYQTSPSSVRTVNEFLETRQGIKPNRVHANGSVQLRQVKNREKR